MEYNNDTTSFLSNFILLIYYILQSEKFEEAGAVIGLTPSDVVGASDITFSCVADPQVAKDVCFSYHIYIKFIFIMIIFTDGIWKLWSTY